MSVKKITMVEKLGTLMSRFVCYAEGQRSSIERWAQAKYGGPLEFSDVTVHVIDSGDAEKIASALEAKRIADAEYFKLDGKL